MKITTHKELEIWQEAMVLAMAVFTLLAGQQPSNTDDDGESVVANRERFHSMRNSPPMLPFHWRTGRCKRCR